jgi:plasmid stabilization system protein ParE
MPAWIHRTTKQVLRSVPSRKLPEAEANYIQDPDLSAVTGQPVKYWEIAGDVVSLADQATRDAIDAADLIAARDAIAAQIDQQEDLLRAFALLMVDELNILRAEHALPDRTIAQLKTAMRNKLGS